MIEDSNYINDYYKTLDSIKAITTHFPEKGNKILNKALKKVINEDITKINVYFLIYKLAYISTLFGNTIDVDSEYHKLIDILSKTISNNRNTYYNYRALKKLINSKKKNDINDIVALYFDIKNTSYLNLSFFNQSMDLLNLDKKNIQYQNIPDTTIDESNNNIKKRIRTIQGTK